MKYIILLFLLFISSSTLYGQTANTTLDNIPEETVHIHTNTSLCFAGEYLYYKFYCVLSESLLHSTLSKVGYVDLINEEKEIIFQHKLTLTEGTGFSEFFIPADLPSGNYKLIGYTNWMRNFGPVTFYKQDITILNPYLGDQNVFLKDDQIKDTLNIFNSTSNKKNKPNNIINLKIDKNVYKQREKVNLEVTAIPGTKLAGTYSISVRRITTLDNGIDTIRSLITNRNNHKRPSSYPFLPESRGEFLSGNIEQEKNSAQKLMISFPGENNVFHVASTNSTGDFNIPLSVRNNNEDMYIRPFLSNGNFEKISIRNNQNIDYGMVNFNSFLINKEMKNLIVERSIHNQIENAYFDSKPDSIIQTKALPPFYSGEKTQYILDEYKRFSTLKETFVEILKLVSIGKDSKGKTIFKIIPKLPLLDSGISSLVLLDGAYIHDHERLLNLPSKSIEKITIARDQYLYGSYSFQGIMDIRTFEGDSYKNYLDNNTQSFKNEQFRVIKKYYREDYSGNKKEQKKHIPDFRNQLAWIPEIAETENSFDLNFYTSDVTGDYEISIQGISSTGVPIQVTKRFNVE
ncbi:hypothetical protein [Maribacter huludaoensis]|uniref:hypothetical protein n=1 Tax=Maribacter huludaoensis TaxID=3030010 RepID=UPI0023EC0903|nr:hypothetical protein [Maribacter huludaoensis]MDF4221155.1 hypothetical protein [Maribacter huludaoensis]